MVISDRPPSKQHLRALQCQVASLESFIQRLAASDDGSRQEMLAKYVPSQHVELSPAALPNIPDTPAMPTSSEIILARTRDGRMKKFSTRKSIQFFGGTSLFQLQLPTPSESTPNGPSTVASSDTNGPSPTVAHTDDFAFRPFDDICRSLMVLFFQNVYHYNMCVYREYFLRDYSNRGGPYYSDMLLYSICAVGALISENKSHRALSAVFAKHAQSLLFESLELPELTTLQSLIILGQYEIGQGRSSKGWLLCGLACRLTHEMGLHLDPNNWNSGADSSIDREILRRVYWAVFIVDKQLSLFFGRPPALYPHEADVRNTIRIPYPPEWESLIDAYLSKGTSATAFEDGISTVGAFTHLVELSKIFHRMIADVFENRLNRTDSTAVEATVHQVHTALVKWLAALPQRLHWNQWTVGKVPHYVLHLHMVFHTGMIILHRPPQQHINDEAILGSEGVEICYESLAAILRLVRSYKRYYHFEMLPLDFVHTLSAATGVIFMKRHMEKSSWAE
ncbi:hypothetical protein NPX13_g5804 [Xylaria arbuscula]|uniref:Xylanolytic transcriptional activator regulatory domain-containing protein n=1 Tax=Xylaria arbuscula TaxID=114810 RepID=A0A9W8NDW0_9PEZI|nr:hypothetical protein NPX13_g5804 [Xylaria arbuscula]